MQKEHASFHVGFKLLLKRDEEVLFLTDAVGGHFDFPGGRIDANEFYVSIPDIISREVREEIGDVKYSLIRPVLQTKRHFESKNLHIFLTFYEANYISGNIVLSSEHNNYKWINPKTHKFKAELFHNLEEYQLLKSFLRF